MNDTPLYLRISAELANLSTGRKLLELADKHGLNLADFQPLEPNPSPEAALKSMKQYILNGLPCLTEGDLHDVPTGSVGDLFRAQAAEKRFHREQINANRKRLKHITLSDVRARLASEIIATQPISEEDVAILINDALKADLSAAIDWEWADKLTYKPSPAIHTEPSRSLAPAPAPPGKLWQFLRAVKRSLSFH